MNPVTQLITYGVIILITGATIFIIYDMLPNSIKKLILTIYKKIKGEKKDDK